MKYDGDTKAMLKVLGTKPKKRNDVFGKQKKITQQIVGGCLAKVEKEQMAKQAETQRAGGPWGSPEVLAAAAAINMTTKQNTAFRAVTGEFVDDLMRTLATIMKQQQGDNEQKFRLRRRGLIEDMDTKVKGILNHEQYPRYVVYRELLVEKLDSMRAPGRRRR